MKKIVVYSVSVIYYLFFLGCLVFFHVLQVLGYRLFGYAIHKKSVDYLNFMLLRCLNLLGTRIDFPKLPQLPTNRPLLIVSNHQSTYDIPPIIWYFRAHHPKFISKKELGKGIPSVSYNLRHGGSVLIDRKDSKAALVAITAFAQRVEKNNWAAVIFPEGTRSKTGVPRRFQRNGLRTLLEHMPRALIVPISVNNSWKLGKDNYFPMPLGIRLTFKIHDPIEPSHFSEDDLLDQLEATIKSGILDV